MPVTNFVFVESPGFRFFTNFNCKNGVNSDLHAGLLFDRIVELYAACKNSMRKQIDNVKEGARIPMFHILIDEWFCKILRQRFIAVRIRFVDAPFEMVTILLSIRQYDRYSMNGSMMTASVA